MTARLALVVLAASLGTTAAAEDAYYHVPVRELKLTGDSLPTDHSPFGWRTQARAGVMVPYAVLDGEGEAYVDFQSRQFNAWTPPAELADVAWLSVRAPAGRAITGRLYFPAASWQKIVSPKFTIPAEKAEEQARIKFNEGKLAWYESLLASRMPGGAWFRHEAREAEIALHRKPRDLADPSQWRSEMAGDLEDTYALFTGGRALSENLQLDRVLPSTRRGEATVELSSISGITVHEIDWKPIVKDLHPQLDPLASQIPADQHAVFFPSFAAMLKVADTMAQQGTVVLRLATPRAEDSRIVQRYERQMGVTLDGLARLLGPQVARSVALTGSDPYFPTGTDVALLFESPQPALLQALLSAKIKLAAQGHEDAKSVQGKVEDVAYQGIETPDRSVSSYLATIDGTVVVTNSLHQLERVASAAKNKTPSIASLPEYTFFRDRYRLGDVEETALVFLSDATIRRWCGPQWRIAASRRTREMALLAEIQADHMGELVKETAKPGPIYTDWPGLEGKLELGPGGVRSSIYGSLEFVTPIAEIPMSRVTKAEAEAYQIWRDRYQQNWQWAFDPIALRLSLRDTSVGADLTVMPLILGTEYREFVDVSRGASFAPDAGDRHDSLAHVILAFNKQSPTFQRGANFLSQMAQGVSFGWLGQSIELYADDDPFWSDLEKVPAEKRTDFLDKKFYRLPIALRAEVTNGLKLAAFLTAFRAFVEQSSPGMTRWESLKYNDQAYVKITPAQESLGMFSGGFRELALYYAPSGDSLLVTLNENVLKRALDRRKAKDAEPKQDKSGPLAESWLGSSLALHLERGAFDAIAALGGQDYQAVMQARAWGNLPILNQWKRLYPDQDPVAVHQRVWKTRLVCPGGGSYTWNEADRTMESSVYGSPVSPKPGPAVPAALDQFARGSFGVTFEDQGLRARAVLEKKSAK